MEALLTKIYNDPADPGSYGGVEPLLRRARVKDSSTTRSNVIDFLRKQDGYTMHRTPVRRFRRRTYIARHPNRILQADLADMQLLASHNDGYRYILVVIDAFSRMLYARPLKNKTAEVVGRAFHDILENELAGAPIKFLHTDAGTEFLNRTLRALLHRRSIKLMHSDNAETKAAMAERVIRTIKHRIYAYFTQNNSLRWIDVLEKVRSAYNSSHHRGIQTTPERAHRTHARGQGKEEEKTDVGRPVAYKFTPGDTVRLSNPSQSFKKGFQSQWTREIFIVWKRFPTDPPTYMVRDAKGDPIRGTFYAQELQHVTRPDAYKIEEILSRRVRRGVKEVLVKWLGYPDSHNSWEPASAIEKL